MGFIWVLPNWYWTSPSRPIITSSDSYNVGGGGNSYLSDNKEAIALIKIAGLVRIVEQMFSGYDYKSYFKPEEYAFTNSCLDQFKTLCGSESLDLKIQFLSRDNGVTIKCSACS